MTGSYTTIDWSALRWSTSKLLSPGSTYLSIYGWVHCIFTICVFLGLFYAIGIAARSSRFPTLLEVRYPHCHLSQAWLYAHPSVCSIVTVVTEF